MMFRYPVLILGVLILLPLGEPGAQSHQQASKAKGYFSGQKMLVTYREGGPVYGTYFFLEIHYCRSGQYLLFGQSRKQTVLGNAQVNNWRDNGTWNIISFQGKIALQYQSTSGRRDLIPIQLLPDGSIWVNEGVSIQKRGRAQCR